MCVTYLCVYAYEAHMRCVHVFPQIHTTVDVSTQKSGFTLHLLLPSRKLRLCCLQLHCVHQARQSRSFQRFFCLH